MYYKIIYHNVLTYRGRGFLFLDEAKATAARMMGDKPVTAIAGGRGD